MKYYNEIYRKIHNRSPKVLGHEQAEKFSVLLPLIEYKGETTILFQVRSLKLNTQPGEISLPGGGREKIDYNDEMTAIRETCEELGLQETDINVLGQLDTVVTPFNALIRPFVGRIDDYRKIIPNKDEVKEIFYVPLEYFLNNEPFIHNVHLTVTPSSDFPFHLIPNGENYNWRTSNYPERFYLYHDWVIWGLTARIVHHFIQLIKQG